MSRPSTTARPLTVFRGYLVHALTTSTLVWVVLGVQWTLEGRYQAAILAMLACLGIDAVDGSLARAWDVKRTAPGIDGTLLDNIVDFSSYVLLPALFLLHADLLAGPGAVVVAFMVLASAYGFSRSTAKMSAEGFFVGFPCYWPLVILYLYLLATPAWVNTFAIVILSLLVFPPVKFLYVSRLPRHRTLHWILGSIWALACVVATLMPAGETREDLLLASLSYVLIYLLHSLWLSRPKLART